MSKAEAVANIIGAVLAILICLVIHYWNVILTVQNIIDVESGTDVMKVLRKVKI